MTFELTDAQREDPRSYLGPTSVRLPGRSMRLARIRLNQRLLWENKMLRPRVVTAAVHSHAAKDYLARGKKITVQFAPRWIFGRGDTFPGANHGRNEIYYGRQ